MWYLPFYTLGLNNSPVILWVSWIQSKLLLPGREGGELKTKLLPGFTTAIVPFGDAPIYQFCSFFNIVQKAPPPFEHLVDLFSILCMYHRHLRILQLFNMGLAPPF